MEKGGRRGRGEEGEQKEEGGNPRDEGTKGGGERWELGGRKEEGGSILY